MWTPPPTCALSAACSATSPNAGRSTESVINQYLETVRPMHKQFIEPTKRNADVILPHGANGPAVDIITTKVVSLLRELDR